MLDSRFAAVTEQAYSAFRLCALNRAFGTIFLRKLFIAMLSGGYSPPMRHHKAMQWEKTLKGVFDEIDRELEEQYGDDWPLHPSRPEEGTTSNPEHDGLFNIGAAFSAGIGSKHGPGYTVEIRLSTLKNVPTDVRAKIKKQVFHTLEKRLPAAFPGQELKVAEENGTIRIYGDLSLDG
jgi:hypothetical protein